MLKIAISNFKAFNDTLTLDFIKANLLLYGDNGVGKSSIFEALKVIFFWERLESELPSNLTPEEFQQYKNNLWASFNNKQLDQNFQLKINDEDFLTFDKSNYQVFMISLPDLYLGGALNLRDLLQKFFLDINDVDSFCVDAFQSIQEEVNKSLTDFRETVRIEIDPEDGFNVVIIDDIRGISRKSDIRSYFNEGKINLILLLLLFSSIYLSKNNTKKRLVILDDFITSLDISNRTFVTRYIFKLFADCQILILTHNATFFNLIKYIIHNVDRQTDAWMFANMYEISGKHKIYIKDPVESVGLIKQEYENVESHNQNSIEQLGNRIRKKFETLLHEFSKILVIGGFEENKIILERISNGKSFYAKKGGLTVYNLMDEIEGLIHSVPIDFLKQRLRSKIESYKDFDLQTLKFVLNELKLYQKVTMHPMSHGVQGMASFTAKEIEQSIGLLIKMEEVVNGLIDGNVTSV
jgi:energy-coupling factor transporter ATP-binding protein EcfA2